MDPHLDQLRDELLDLTGRVSAEANKIKLGLIPNSTQSASAQVISGTTAVSWAVGMIGVFAIVVAVASVVVVSAWRHADASVVTERAANQRVVNEDLLDRVRLLEVKVKKLEEKQRHE